jgi:integrase
MASIKFLLQSDRPHSPIYCRLSAGRQINYKRKTGLTVNPELWDNDRGRMLGRNSTAKAINTNLTTLEEYVFNVHNKDQMAGLEIDGFWLESVIAEFYNRGQKEDEQITELIDYATNYISRLDSKVSHKKGKQSKGTSERTKKKYRTVLGKLVAYEQHIHRTIKLSDVTGRFGEEFSDYLDNVDGLKPNTSGKYVKMVKTILRDARKNGLDVSPMIDDIRGYTEDVPKVILSPSELSSIHSLELDANTLERARDWLIIGCYTGQRVSDLLRMNSSMIQEIQGFRFIVLTQVKTDKLVQIPIHPIVRDILSFRGGEFPESFGASPDSASALFNRYVKEVCKLVGVDEPTEGNLMNPKTGRSAKGTYPKWKLISSHTCRRSFASNFYAEENYPTPILMNITAHSTEKQFLEYIGKKPLDYSLQLARLWNP